MPSGERPQVRFLECKARQAGFTYLLLLIMLAIVGIASAASVTLGAAMSRQDAQRETRANEEDFKQALESYRFNTPVGQPVMGPKRLEDLLADTRGGRLRRHLRRIPADPLTGKNDWIAVMGTDGGIELVCSTVLHAPETGMGIPGQGGRSLALGPGCRQILN